MRDVARRSGIGARFLAVAAAWAAFGPAPSVVCAQWVTQPVSAPRVQYRIFYSPAAGSNVSYHIYTPPAYDTQPQLRFPVLYWLHGSDSVLSGIAPLSAWFDAAIAQGELPPLLVVFPNGMAYRMWCDSHDGTVPMESVVIDDLVPVVDASFRTIPSRDGRILEGFSMGGQGTGRLALRRADLFAGASMLGAGPLQLDFLQAPPGSTMPWELRLQIYDAVWGSDPAYYLAQHPWTIAADHAAEIVAGGMKVRVVVGQADNLLAMNQDFHDHLSALGIPHHFEIVPGVGHDVSSLFTAMGESNWDFYREILEGQAGRLTASGPLLLALDRGTGEVALEWGPSCRGGDRAYAVYQGTLGDFTSHAPVACGIGDPRRFAYVPPPGDLYYLVVPVTGSREGSYGTDSSGAERPAGSPSCLPRSIASCP